MSETNAPALWFNARTRETAADRTAGLALVSGHGCHVRDAAGREYLDARSALWNASLGYDDRTVADAMRRQLDTLPVAQSVRHDQPPETTLRYAERLVAALPAHLTHVRLCTTGSQAVEGAVLLSRFTRIVGGDPGRTQVLAHHDGYHGIGGLASALTGEPPLHGLHGPLVPGVHHVRPWDLDDLRATLERVGPERVTAVVVEPILGTGVREAPPGYLAELERTCHEHGIHLVVDEVSTGFGRTGSLTVTGELGVRPDILLLSKGISAGYAPLAAIATTSAVFEAALARPEVGFPHGSTADGHPVAAAAGLAVLDVLADGRVLANVRARGRQLTEALRELPVAEVRGRGLMIAVDLRDEHGEPFDAGTVTALRLRCRDEGLLLSTADSTVILTPPLVITQDECRELVDRFARCVRELVPALSAS